MEWQTKYTLDQVIKKCLQLEKKYDKDSTEQLYYNCIVRYLRLEHKYKDAVEKAGKPIYHYFMYLLPRHEREYFNWLYNPYNPVRFALETFDSVEEIREELKRQK